MMPAGHWAGARYNPDMQYRYAALAVRCRVRIVRPCGVG